jgi:hypothetical protein
MTLAGRPVLVLGPRKPLTLDSPERRRAAIGFELWEIARAGGGWRPQLAYAARQVLAARRLRAPQRRGATP